MSFINGISSSQKPLFGCNNNIDMRETREPHFVDDSAELSIFDAKKYFNEVSAYNIDKVSPVTTVEHMSTSEQHEQDLDRDSEPSESKPWTCGAGVTHPSSASTSTDKYHRSNRAQSFHFATPTVSSEASWNSQTGLLTNPPGAVSVSVLRGDSKSRKQTSSSTSSTTVRWIFGSSRCPCIGKKSIQVEESKVSLDQKTSAVYVNNNTINENTMHLQQYSQNDAVWSNQRHFPPNLLLQGPTTQRVIASNGFTFPILKNNTILLEDPPRNSLEVFKPSSDRGGGGGDGGLKSRILANVAASGGNATVVNDIDDAASDASSDLFEIESFSTQTTSTTAALYPTILLHRRDSMELEARRLRFGAATTRRSVDSSTDWYEPSEASIDWSVTTAEGFDRASIANMSEGEELWNEKNNNSNNNNNNNSRRRSSLGNGLLSCRSEKAVSVGPQPVTKHVGSRPPLGKKPPLAKVI